MPEKIITLQLPESFVGQIIDGLDVRLESYERTVAYYHGEPVDGDIEECNYAEEAETIAATYREIITTIQEQRERSI